MAKRYIRPLFYATLIQMLDNGEEITPISVQKAMNWTEDDHDFPGIGQEIIKTFNASKGYCYRSDVLLGIGIDAMNDRRLHWFNAGGKVTGSIKLDKPYKLLSGSAKGEKGSGSGISTTVSPDDDYTAQLLTIISRPLTKEEINQANLEHFAKMKKILDGQISNRLLAQWTGVSEPTVERYLSGYDDWVSSKWLKKLDELFEVAG